MIFKRHPVSGCLFYLSLCVRKYLCTFCFILFVQFVLVIIYDERFYRMWKFYLLSSAGSFRARNVQLWQIVLSKKGIPGGYLSIR